MKVIKNKKYKFSLLWSLALIACLAIWSCEEDDGSDRLTVSTEIMLPKVTSINPSSGVIGTEVTITGENFSDSVDDISISFTESTTTATVTASSETSITVIVPPGAKTGDLDIRVGSSKVLGGPSFTVPLPQISSYSISSGILGTEVIITGANFSADLSDNAVAFNGVEAEVTEASATTLIAIVPSGATTGIVEVTVDGQIGTGPEFTVPLPMVSSYDVTTGATGDTVIISGSNFSTAPDDNIVTFTGGAEAEVTESIETSITVTIPYGAFTGSIEVSVGEQVGAGPEFSIPVVTLAIGIVDDLDDLEENVTRDGFIFDTSDLELGETEGGDLYNIGLRYQNVPIPQGTIITSAHIQFQADADGDEPTEMNIFGHNYGNAEPFDDNVPSSITQRPITDAFTYWNIPEWVRGDRGDAQKTPEITAIVQEIVNGGDWASGNNMSFILEPTGISATATSSSQGREAEADPGSDSATLVVVFSAL